MNCPYCNKPILKGQPTVTDSDGDIYHIGCAVEESDGYDLDNEHGDN